MRTLDVGLGARAYPIHIGRGALARAGGMLKAGASRRAVIVTNAVVAAHHLARLKASLVATAAMQTDVVLLPDGEAHKNSATLLDLVTRLLELRVDRATTLIALGGGVIGDIAGFAAAIYQRGLAFVQVPTTLLAQVDSSVGGKTGINHPLGKNMIGAFWQPRAVLIDTDCLSTLPDRELRAGIAEVIKHGAIRDADFFDWLEANMPRCSRRTTDALDACDSSRVARSRPKIVAADERETGERALLNFGHTFGHAIEAAQGYGDVAARRGGRRGNGLRGEAVRTRLRARPRRTRGA